MHRCMELFTNMLINLTEKHLGTSDLMYLTSSKLVVALTFGFGGICSGVPFTMAWIVTFLRWSPAMLPYHVFGHKEKLMELELNNSMAYWSVLLLDWAACTVGAMAACCAASIILEAFVRIILISRALRCGTLNTLCSGLRFILFLPFAGALRPEAWIGM